MSQLTIYNAGKFEKLAESPKVTKVPTLKSDILDMLQKASILNGGTKDPDYAVLDVHVEAIYTDLIHIHSWLTQAELNHLFSEGLRGKYGEFFGINYKTVCEWIIAYRDSPERKSYLESKTKVVELPPPVMTQDQKDQDDRDFVNYNHELHKKCPLKLQMIPVILYKILYKNGKINFTDEEKEDIREQAKELFTMMKKDGTIDEYMLQNLDEQKSIDNLAKRIAIRNIFNSNDKIF